MNADARAGRSPALAAGALGAGAVACLAVGLIVIVGVLLGVQVFPPTQAPAMDSSAADGVSALALREIPRVYLALYRTAGIRYGLDWSILAGVGKVECDHGRDPDPSCTVEGAVNSAGAGGPMQFLSSTWARYGVDADHDGKADRWDPADAIFSAAAYLRASGAPVNIAQALFAYNHAAWYVAEVQRWAARYRGGRAAASPQTPAGDASESEGSSVGESSGFLAPAGAPVRFVAGERAVLSPGDGHVALVPTAAPPVVQATVVAGNELQALPYGAAGHPDPRGATQEDCSSAVNYVLYRSGVRPIAEILHDNPLAQDYVHWGAPGPGRWITIYATDVPTAHVFAVIAGLRLDTSHNGTDVGPNRDQDGPRWRLLDQIPTWAHWAVRHPPGL